MPSALVIGDVREMPCEDRLGHDADRPSVQIGPLIENGEGAASRRQIIGRAGSCVAHRLLHLSLLDIANGRIVAEQPLVVDQVRKRQRTQREAGSARQER